MNPKIKDYETASTVHSVSIAIYFFSIVVICFIDHDLFSKFLYFISFFLIIVIHYVCREGLRKGKKWAKFSSVLIGFIFLLGFPFFTVLGVFLIYFIVRPVSKNFEEKE